MKSDIKRAKFGKKIVETETFSIDTRIKIIDGITAIVDNWNGESTLEASLVTYLHFKSGVRYQ